MELPIRFPEFALLKSKEGWRFQLPEDRRGRMRIRTKFCGLRIVFVQGPTVARGFCGLSRVWFL